MLVQINTDSRVECSEDATAAMEARLRERLARFADRLTRIEVHLRDVDGDRNGPQGIEAKIEVRPAGGEPMVTTDNGADAEAAMAGALRKVVDSLDRAFGKQDAVR